MALGHANCGILVERQVLMCRLRHELGGVPGIGLSKMQSRPRCCSSQPGWLITACLRGPSPLHRQDGQMANKSRAPSKTPRAAKPKGVPAFTVNGIESPQPFLAAQLSDSATPSGAARKAAMSPEEVSARVREFNLKPTVSEEQLYDAVNRISDAAVRSPNCRKTSARPSPPSSRQYAASTARRCRLPGSRFCRLPRRVRTSSVICRPG